MDIARKSAETAPGLSATSAARSIRLCRRAVRRRRRGYFQCSPPISTSGLPSPFKSADGNTGLQGIGANPAELLRREDRFDLLARREPAVLQAAEHVEAPLLTAIGAGDEVQAAVAVVVRQLRSEHAVVSADGGSSGRHLVVEPDRLGEPRLGLAARDSGRSAGALRPPFRGGPGRQGDRACRPRRNRRPRGTSCRCRDRSCCRSALSMGTPPTETATGAARSAASPAAAGTRSPNPTQLAAAASASRTRIGILQFSSTKPGESIPAAAGPWLDRATRLASV